MSKFKGKLTKRIMAIVLSGAMVMSNMSAYAAELAPETETAVETVSEVEESTAAETAADNAEEKSVSDAENENAEAESSVAGDSESTAAKAETEEATAETVTTEETKTEDTAETDAETEESSVTETESASATETETEETIESEQENKAEVAAADKVTYSQGAWSNNSRTTSWDFVTTYPEKATTLKVGDSLKGVKVIQTKVQLKTASDGKTVGQGLTLTKDTSTNGIIAIPLDADTEKVSITITLASLTAGRWMVIGNSETNKIVHHLSSGDGYDSTIHGLFDETNHDWTGEYDTSYMSTDSEGKWLYLEGVGGDNKINTISITETKKADSGAETLKADWDTEVGTPAIEKAVQDADESGKLKNSVTVTVLADIAEGHGSKVEVILCDANGTPMKDSDDKNISLTATNVTEDNIHTLVFDKQLTASGTYTFKAVLSRPGEGEGAPDQTKDSTPFAQMTDAEKEKATVNFKLPLAKPEKLTAKNTSTEDDPFVDLTWQTVDGAESYIVSLLDGSTKLYEEVVTPNEENTSTDETSGISTVKYTVSKNIKFGKKYTFNVAAQKGEGETYEASEAATVDCKVEIVEKDAEGTEWKVINIVEDTVMDGNTEKKGLKPDKMYGDETILKLSVLDNMYASEIDPPKNIDGVDYGYSVQGKNDPKKDDGKGAGGAIPTTGAAFKLEAVTNAKIKFVTGSASKTYYLIKVLKDDKGDVSSEVVKTDTAIPEGTMKFDLDAGCTYYFYGAGTKIKVYDIQYCNDTTRMVPQSINIAEGLKADTTYGDEKYVVINVLEDMPATALTTEKEIEGVKYKASIQGKTNPSPDGGKIPAAPSAAFKMKAIDNVKITFVTGSAAKTYHLVKAQVAEDGTETVVEEKSDTAIPEGTLTFILDAGYTYYFYGDSTKVKLYDISYAKYVEVKRTNWDYIAEPVITGTALHTEKNEKPENAGRGIDVTVDAAVGTKGGDSVTVEMFDSEGSVVATGISKAEKNTHVITLTPSKSDSYTFKATLARDTEVDEEGNETEYDPKESAETKAFPFILPLDPPAISSVTNRGEINPGEGKVEIEWASAKEATGYTVNVYSEADCKEEHLVMSKDSVDAVLNEDGTVATKAEVKVEIEGLEVGKTYYFTAYSRRGADRSVLESDPFEKTIKADAEDKWSFAAYGSSTSITAKTWKLNTDEKGERIKDENGKDTASNVAKNGFAGDYYKGWVNVWSMGGAGKVVPATVDGLAFYYTEIPKDKNFRLTATAHVNEWVLSNGQDGFGLMAADQVGENGNSDYLWTNSYQAVVSKIEYNWDGEAVTTDTTKPKIAMKIGVGATEKVGATKEDIEQLAAGDIATPKKWSAVQTPLDTTYAKYAKAGITTTCNMVGNTGAWNSKTNEWEANPAPSDASETFVDFELTLEKNNTGYFLSYKMPNGQVVTQKYYDPKALNQIVEDTVYVGFFAARNANVTFTDIDLNTTDESLYLPAEERPTTYITLTKAIGSASVTNSSNYDLIFTSNWDGQLEVRNSENKVVGKADVTGSLDTVKANLEDGDNEKDTKAHIELSGLEVGNNVFTLTYTPSKNMKNAPELTKLRSYDAVTLPLTVEYRKYGSEGENLYVAPDGTSTGTGTKDDPLDIFTAIKYVQPGQTILLAGGTYSLYKTIKIETSICGKPAKDGEDKYKNYIKMIADPESVKTEGRPVFDFNGVVTGMTLGGNYWYFKGFDVTRSLDGQKGIQLSGSNNVLDQVNTYKNGNTGIQVSGSGNDTYKYWPQNNLVLNCTSFLNADHGYEDADGFAAKLTIGSGNIFDGCIAAYNADDGWDLFAKLESGQIGSVTIQNCVAYRNGYVLRADDGKGALDLAGKLVNAGNGNGFKMGGDGLPGGSIHDADYKVDENGEPVYSGHKLKNSVAFENKSKGFDSNSCSNNKIYNSISFNNEGSNVALYTHSTVKKTGYVTDGVISFRTKYKTVTDEISARNQAVTDYTNDTTYLWSPKDKAAVNASNTKVTADWFESVTFKGTNTIEAYGDKNGVLLGRNDNGTINMAGFLKLKDSSSIQLGGQGSAEDTDLKGDKETDGTVSVGNGEIVDDTASEELSKEQNAVNSELTTNKNYGLYVKWIEDVYYTGTAVQPEFRVYLNGTLFTDYKVSYKNNVNAYVGLKADESNKADHERYKDIPDAKRPTMILTLKGSYQGTYEYYFDILPIDITDETLVSITGLSGTALPARFAPTLIYNGKKLAAAKDYEATLENGKYKIDATKGTNGNFKGIKEGTYRVSASATDISKAKFKLETANFTYTGAAIEPEVTMPDGVKKEDVRIVYSNNINVGKATATIIAKDDAASIVGSASLSFSIKKTPLKLDDNVFITGCLESYPYTGAALSPAKITVQVTPVKGDKITIYGVKKGSKDVNAKDKNGLYKYGYTYQYKANTEVGNATLTVSGIHNFSGSVSYRFKITPPESVTTSKVEYANGSYDFNNKDLEVGYKPTAEYTPNGTTPDVVIKYKGNTVSAKNYSITYKNNKNVTDTATATGTVKWKGSLKNAAPVDFSYKITPCDFTSGNIVAKSVSDVFTNAKESIKYSDLEKSKVVLVNVNKKLTNNRDYRLVYKWNPTEVEVTNADGTKTIKTEYKGTYDPQNKADAQTELPIAKETGLDVTVFAYPVGENYKPNNDGIVVAEFRVAWYNIAQAKMQFIDKTTEKVTPLYFVDDTESRQSNLGSLNRLNNKVKDPKGENSAPYYLVVSHSQEGELKFSNYENMGNTEKQADYTYDYENTATTAAGKHTVTIYGTGKFGGSKVLKYTLVQKTYDLTKSKMEKMDPVTIPAGKDVNTVIKDALAGKIMINGKALDKEFYDVSFDPAGAVSGASLKVTITGADVNGIRVYSGFKTVSVKIG